MSTPPTRLDARLVRGFKDTGAADLRARARMVETIRGVYERYGFEPLETPALEYVDVLGKFLPEQEKPDEGIFALKDADDQWIALRYDLTAPLSRYVAENIQTLPMPFRRYQVGPVWRDEKPGPGRFREFYQFDVDTVGSASMLADAENAMIMAEAMEALGFPAGDYAVRMNNRKVLDGVLETIGLSAASGSAELGKSLTVLRAMDKFDRVGAEGVHLLLTAGRKDESGDFTPGAGLSAAQADSVLAYMGAGEAGKRRDIVARLRDIVKASAIGTEGVAELEQIDAILTGAGLGDNRVAFDPATVRGLAYYTGPVLEVALTFEIVDEKGQRKQVGSVAGGGRYDGLVSRFTDKKIPATGVSIGVDRLLAALKISGRLKENVSSAPIVVLVMDRARLADYEIIATELRRGGLVAEVYLGEGGMKPQMRYADRRGAALAIIAGGDEFAANAVSIKDMRLGKELSENVADNKEWRDKSRAQVTVPRGEMIARVRAMLAGS